MTNTETGFVPPDGATEREAARAEFWKPKAEGSVLVGLVTGFRTRKFADKESESVEFEPCLVYDAGAKPQAYRALEVNLNSDLKRRVGRDTLKKVIAIKFVESVKTKGGATPMRTFQVIEGMDAAWLVAQLTKAGADELCELVGDGLPF